MLRGVGVVATAAFALLHRPVDVGLFESQFVGRVALKADLFLFGELEDQRPDQTVALVARLAVVGSDGSVNDLLGELRLGFCVAVDTAFLNPTARAAAARASATGSAREEVGGIGGNDEGNHKEAQEPNGQGGPTTIRPWGNHRHQPLTPSYR